MMVNSEPVEKPRMSERFSETEAQLSEHIEDVWVLRFPKIAKRMRKKAFHGAPFVPESLIGDGSFPFGRAKERNIMSDFFRYLRT